MTKPRGLTTLQWDKFASWVAEGKQQKALEEYRKTSRENKDTPLDIFLQKIKQYEESREFIQSQSSDTQSGPDQKKPHI